MIFILWIQGLLHDEHYREKTGLYIADAKILSGCARDPRAWRLYVHKRVSRKQNRVVHCCGVRTNNN